MHSPTYQTNIGMFLLMQCDYWKSLVVLFGSSIWIMVLNVVLLDFFCSCGNTLWESMCCAWYVSACVRRYHYDVSSSHHHQIGSRQGTHSTITTLKMWFSGSLQWFLYFELVVQSILNTCLFGVCFGAAPDCIPLKNRGRIKISNRIRQLYLMVHPFVVRLSGWTVYFQPTMCESRGFVHAGLSACSRSLWKEAVVFKVLLIL